MILIARCFAKSTANCGKKLRHFSTKVCDGFPVSLLRFPEDAVFAEVGMTNKQFKTVSAHHFKFDACQMDNGQVPAWGVTWHHQNTQSVNYFGLSAFTVDHLTREQQRVILSLFDRNKKLLPCNFLPAHTAVPNFSFVTDSRLSSCTYGAESSIDTRKILHVLLSSSTPMDRKLFDNMARCEWPASWQEWRDPTLGHDDPLGHDADLPDTDDWELELVIQGLEEFALNPDKPSNLRFMARLVQYEIANSCSIVHCRVMPDFLLWAPLAIEGLQLVARRDPHVPNWPHQVLWTLKEEYALERKARAQAEGSPVVDRGFVSIVVGAGEWAPYKRDHLVNKFRHETALPSTDNDILVAPASVNLVIKSDFPMPPFSNLPLVIEHEQYGKVTFTELVEQPTLGTDGTHGLPEFLVEGSEEVRRPDSLM